ncbi:MAG: arginase family protein [Bacteroidetes bacterium]|nr:arginase family protein [Bacteroidota bacterium]
MQDLRPFFEDRHFLNDQPDGTYQSFQWGAQMPYATSQHFDWQEADIIIVGCGEVRGYSPDAEFSYAPDAIREQLYQLYNWHPAVKIVDAGNIREGLTIGDTRAALRAVLAALHEAGKMVIVLGGSHDLTMQQYEAFKKSKTIINASVVDMLVDLDDSETLTARSFLLEMLSSHPNYIRHYNHIGFQSYYVQPRMLETLDKLRFDFFRLGRVREHFDDMEPVLRNTDLFSFDISAIRYSDAPVNSEGSPNGFTGDEACILTRFAGMSEQLSSFGIYGYEPRKDRYRMTAKLIAQMIWYFIDGYLIRKNEAKLTDHEEFMEFHITFSSNDTTFVKSKRTNRWWMKLPNGLFTPCSYNDYLLASKNEIPERWLREQERLV